jgi:hypothetical protein
MLSKHISFGTVDAYYATLEDTILGIHQVFSPFSSFMYPCDALTFSHDYNTMYFTRFYKKDDKEKIFSARFANNNKNQSGWLLENTPLDFCKGDYRYAYPAISSDDSIIVFASDRQGTLGGMDLFITRRKEGKWSAPENLGDLINTRYNEICPFLDSENNLFFSSDGLPGFGGYDLFSCKFNGKGWDKPANLSRPINSNSDDIAFTINKTDEKTAFFTRRQKSVNTEMQLFVVRLNKNAAKNNLLTISYVFNGKPALKTDLTSIKDNNGINKDKVMLAKTEPETDLIKMEPGKKDQKEQVQYEIPDKQIVPAQDTRKDAVIFRVQILSSSKSLKNNKITINGITYSTYEYFYLGAYRYTIGEFRSVAAAKEFRSNCRRSGYPQAFIAAFINNARSLDPGLFK